VTLALFSRGNATSCGAAPARAVATPIHPPSGDRGERRLDHAQPIGGFEVVAGPMQSPLIAAAQLLRRRCAAFRAGYERSNLASPLLCGIARQPAHPSEIVVVEHVCDLASRLVGTGPALQQGVNHGSLLASRMALPP
jgi:hypothetical protein